MASMRLLGKRAWWTPAPLERWLERYGVKEGTRSKISIGEFDAWISLEKTPKK